LPRSGLTQHPLGVTLSLDEESPMGGGGMGENELPEANQDELLAEHVRALADWHKAHDNRGTDAELTDLFRTRAQEAQDAYLQSREPPSADDQTPDGAT
jgi:hypothetical protein